MMTYKGFVGVATIDLDAGILFGRVVNTRSVITFQAETVADLEKEFRTSVDIYLEACEEDGIKPERPSGRQLLIPNDAQKKGWKPIKY